MSLEKILQEHYRVKKVFLKTPRIAAHYTVASGSKYHIYDYMTVSGNKAYTKLIGLMYDLESILGGSFKAAPWVIKLKELVSAGNDENIPAEAKNTCLDSIVMSQFGCKKVFLKKRRKCGYRYEGEPDPEYEYFTRAGGRAYERLVSLLGDLGEVFGKDFNDQFIVSCLDQIVTEDY